LIDAILERDIYNDALSQYLAQGGAPMDAVTLLAGSYIGTPSMCNVVASSATSIGVDSAMVMRQALKQILKDRFNPQRCDELFMKTEVGWLMDAKVMLMGVLYLYCLGSTSRMAPCYY
jgi:hypothetical protein